MSGYLNLFIVGVLLIFVAAGVWGAVNRHCLNRIKAEKSCRCEREPVVRLWVAAGALAALVALVVFGVYSA